MRHVAFEVFLLHCTNTHKILTQTTHTTQSYTHFTGKHLKVLRVFKTYFCP